MAIPTSYTETALNQYMRTITARVASQLALDFIDFDEAVNDALIVYGATDIADATDIPKLRALAAVEAWRVIVNATLPEHDFAVDGGDYKRNQLYKNAVDALSRAQVSAAIYLPVIGSVEYAIDTGIISYSDTYAAVTDAGL